MVDTLRVLGISGSLRKASFNTRLLHIAKEMLPAELSLEIYDLAGLPLYNEDLRKEVYPPELEAFRQALKAVDGVLFACPEYNYSVTGVLKNAIDWASRPEVGAPPTSPHALFNKPAAVMGVGGLAGTARAQLHLRQIAVFLNMPMLMKPEVVINNRSKPAFDEHANLIDQDAKKFLGDMLQAFVPWIKKFKD